MTTAQEILTFFSTFTNSIMIMVFLFALSQLCLTLSVYTSAKARQISNPLLFAATTLFGGIISAIIYLCVKGDLTRAEGKPRSTSVLWLVLSIVLALAALSSYISVLANLFAQLKGGI